jgi:hypothetical protein
MLTFFVIALDYNSLDVHDCPHMPPDVNGRHKPKWDAEQ